MKKSKLEKLIKAFPDATSKKLIKAFPDATSEKLEELEEAIRKLENPTPEEEKEMMEDEQRFSAALRRAYDKDHHEETPVQPFECPVCGSTEYIAHRAYNRIIGPGSRSWISGYECKGCSVTFSDLAKFSNKKQESP